MRNFFKLILIGLVLSSCYHENKPEQILPEKLLSEDELVSVMTDLQLAEGVISHQRIKRANGRKDYKDTVYNVILEHYELSLGDLNENFDYYNSDPQNMELLYEKVLSNLSKLQTEVELSSKKDTISEVEE